jgi:hypothetical protein
MYLSSFVFPYVIIYLNYVRVKQFIKLNIFVLNKSQLTLSIWIGDKIILIPAAKMTVESPIPNPILFDIYIIRVLIKDVLHEYYLQ